jgi:hypothetical protein
VRNWQRLTNISCGFLGITLIALGVILRAHWLWLTDLGSVVIWMNLAVTVLPTMREQIHDYPSMTERLRLLCADAKIPFGQAKSNDRWRLPVMLTALLLATSLHIAAMIFKSRLLLIHSVSDVVEVLFAISFGAYLMRYLRIHRVLRRLESRTRPVSSSTTPPRAAKFVLLLVPKQHREHLIGDLEEEYVTIVLPEYGVKRARLWYWWQVTVSVGPLLWGQMKRAAALAWLWKRVR